jgi:hypothetical protein
MQSSFDDTLKRNQKMYSTLSDISSITGNPFADVALLTDSARLNNQIAMLTSQIELAEESNDPQAIEQVRKDKEALKLAVDFQKKQQTVRQFELDRLLLPEEMLQEKYGTDPNLAYKESYHNLLKGLASTPEKQMSLDSDISAKGGIDSLYDELIDTDMLENHAAGLSKYINMLSDPKGFLEHVDRNYAWMQKIYNNRKDYFKSIVNEQMDAVEKNALLNALADKGIYVDLEQFADWVENNNNFPDYFIDETKGLIVNQDSPLYTEYLEDFIDAAQLGAIKAAGEPVSDKEKMQDRIDELENKRATELEQSNDRYNIALTKAYGLDEAGIYDRNRQILENDQSAEEKVALELQKEEQEVYLNILNGDNVQGMLDIYPKLEEIISEEQFNDAQAIAASDKSVIQRAKDRGPIFNPNAQTAQEKADAINNAFTIEIYKNILEDNIKKLEEDIKNIKTPETLDIEGTNEYKVYQSEIKQINEKYDGFVQEVKDEFKEQGVDENTYEEVTTATPYENLPEDLRAIVDEEFTKFLTEELEDPNLQQTDPENFERTRANWLQSQTELFKAYGEKARAEAVERAKQLARPPFLKFFKLQVSGKDALNTLTEYLNNLQKIIDTGKFPNLNNDSIEATADELALIKEDIEALKGYINSRKQVYKPQNIAQETYNNVEQNIINRRGEVEDVFNEEGVKIGRRFVGQETTTSNTKADIERRRKKSLNNTAKKRTSGLYKRARTIPQGIGFDQFGTLMSVIYKMTTTAVTGQKFTTPKENAYIITPETPYRKSMAEGSVYDEEKLQIAIKELEDRINAIYDAELAALGEDKASTGLPMRATQVSDEVVTKMVGKPEFFYKKLEDGTIQELYDQYMSGAEKSAEGFMLAFERAALGYRLTFGSNPAKIQAVRKALETLPREEFFKAVDNIAFNHRSKAGTNADALIRESLSISNDELTFKAVPYTDSIDINGQRVKVSDIMTKEAYDALFDANTGIIAPLLNDMFDNKLRILSNNVLVFDKTLRDNGITGELDLLALTTDGKLKIIDIKLSSANTWKYYEKENNRKKLEHRAQQSVYQTLVYNMTGITPEISILPVAFEADLDGKITSIKKSSMLAEGQNVYDLEYLPEIEEAGIVRIDPAKTITTTSVTGESTPVVKPVGSVEKTDLSKLTLQDNLGKDLVYNGKAGKLVKLDDGTFAVEYSVQNGVNQVEDLMHNGLPAKDGKLTLNKVGVSPVTEITEVAQVSVINNEVIDAKFDDTLERTATINGVRYTVNRDKTQSIVSLTYRINDARIAAIEDKTAALSAEVTKLREENKKSKDKAEKNAILEKAARAQQEIYALNEERIALVENNPERTMRGGNANDLIFALNRLPNSVTKGHTQKRSLDEKQELKDISNVADSSSTAAKMDKILSENYPEAIDKLFTQGVSSINKSELNTIKAWAEGVVNELERLRTELLDSNNIVDEVDNQIYGIFDLLNDLELINLGKNGKILKQQPEELSKKFGPDNTQEVQTGASVPEIQKPVGEQAETVLRPATEEELRQIVESAKAKDEEIFSDWSTETPVIDFSSAKNLTELDKQFAKAINDNPELASELADARAERLNQIQTEISIDNIQIGEALISKVPIFGEYSEEIVSVKQIKGNNVIVKDLMSDETKTFTEEELKEIFNKTTPEALENIKTPEVTQEDVINSQNTAENLEKFSDDQDAINEAIEEAKTESKENRFKKLFDNSKTC